MSRIVDVLASKMSADLAPYGQPMAIFFNTVTGVMLLSIMAQCMSPRRISVAISVSLQPAANGSMADINNQRIDHQHQHSSVAYNKRQPWLTSNNRAVIICNRSVWRNANNNKQP